jgi:hypothetical protein
MRKAIAIIILGLLLSGCEQNKDKDIKAVEKCADRATAGHFNDRQLHWQKLLDNAVKEKWDWMIEGYKRNVKLYKNYAEKSLKHKMHMNDQYNINFKKCEKEFRQNPLSFRVAHE